MNEPDDILLKRLERRDEAAFEELFLRHYNRVYRVLYSLVDSKEVSEDLAQETFLELYKHVPGIQPGATLPAWLCRVAVNKGYNAMRSERRAQQRLERFSIPHEVDPYTEALRAEERTRVREVLARLPERQSKLLLLRHAGLSLAEIAAAVEVAPGSVGTLLARAERAFVAAFESMHSGEPRDSLEKRKL